MPWFQRDWDFLCNLYSFTIQRSTHALISKGLRHPILLVVCRIFWSTHALISKGLRRIQVSMLQSIYREAPMPWFQRDWDDNIPFPYTIDRKHPCPDFKGIETTLLSSQLWINKRSTHALISKGLRPFWYTSLLLSPKHPCPDFKGIETMEKLRFHHR